MKGSQKLECLFILSSLVRYLWLRQGAYLRVEHLKGVSLGYTPPSLTNISVGWKGLPGTNTLAYFKNLLIMTVKIL
jgi:hypothetical protein